MSKLSADHLRDTVDRTLGSKHPSNSLAEIPTTSQSEGREHLTAVICSPIDQRLWLGASRVKNEGLAWLELSFRSQEFDFAAASPGKGPRACISLLPISGLRAEFNFLRDMRLRLREEGDIRKPCERELLLKAKVNALQAEQDLLINTYNSESTNNHHLLTAKLALAEAKLLRQVRRTYLDCGSLSEAESRVAEAKKEVKLEQKKFDRLETKRVEQLLFGDPLKAVCRTYTPARALQDALRSQEPTKVSYLVPKRTLLKK